MAIDFTLVQRIDFVLSVVGLVMLLYLLGVYVKLYRQLRQKFTLGFIVFTVLLLANNLPGTFFHLRRLGGPPPGGRPPPLLDADGPDVAFVLLRLVPNVFELVAIGVLIWLSRE